MFYGREDLLEQLGALLERPMATLVTCRGRRRIGKSTLIEESDVLDILSVTGGVPKYLELGSGAMSPSGRPWCTAGSFRPPLQLTDTSTPW